MKFANAPHSDDSFSFSFDLAKHILVFFKDEASTLIITHRHHCERALSSSKIVKKMVMLQWNFSLAKCSKLSSFLRFYKAAFRFCEVQSADVLKKFTRSTHRSQPMKSVKQLVCSTKTFVNIRSLFKWRMTVHQTLLSPRQLFSHPRLFIYSF